MSLLLETLITCKVMNNLLVISLQHVSTYLYNLYIYTYKFTLTISRYLLHLYICIYCICIYVLAYVSWSNLVLIIYFIF